MWRGYPSLALWKTGFPTGQFPPAPEGSDLSDTRVRRRNLDGFAKQSRGDSKERESKNDFTLSPTTRSRRRRSFRGEIMSKHLHAVGRDGMTFGMEIETNTVAWRKFKSNIKLETVLSKWGTEQKKLTVPAVWLGAIMRDVTS